MNSLIVILGLFCSHVLISQPKTDFQWTQVPSPEHSNINHVFMFSSTSGIAAGKNLIIYKDGVWNNFSHPTQKKIKLLFAIDTNSIFVTHNTIFQESDLFYWNGISWRKIYHPLANSITSMTFTDENNGVIVGIGEIAILKNGIWEFINSPTNKPLNQVIQQNDSCIWTLSSGNFYKYKKGWKKIESTTYISKIKLYSNDVYVVGNNLLGKIVDDSIFIISRNPTLKYFTIKSFNVINPNNIVILKSSDSLLHYFKGRWVDESLNTKSNINDMSILFENDGWLVGDDGTILHYSNKESDSYIDYWKGFKENNLFRNSISKIVDDEYGVVAADFNNDGLTDIFTCGLYEENHLYINKGDKSFFDESRKRGVSGGIDMAFKKLNLGASAVDWDNDGDIDLYISVLNGKNKLYENIGGKYFVDYSHISNGAGGVEDRTNAVIFGDVDNDGDLDLFITNEYSSNIFYLNNGAGIFKDVTEKLGLTTMQGGMSSSFGDIDNDGDLDLYVANWSGKNIMYKNELIETGNLSYSDISIKSKTSGRAYVKSNAVVFVDIDNDMDLDLYVTNRKTSNRLYLNNGKGVFFDNTEKLLGLDSLKSNGVIIADFDGNGWKDIYVSNVGDNTYYENNNGEFTKKNIGLGGYSTGSAYADIDNDGDLDIYIANYVGESSSLLINKLNNSNFIKIEVRGVKNNRSGVGSKIYVYRDEGLDSISELIDFRQITAGSGYASMNELIQTIQIQDNDFVDVKIVFPNGIIKTSYHIKAGSSFIVSDVNGVKKQWLLVKNLLLRRILDPHELYELIKWIFIFFLILYTTKRGYERYKWSLLFAISIAFGTMIIYFIQYYYLEYDNFFFSTLLPFGSVIALILLLHQFFERKHTKQVAVIEQEQIREKLSRDLHDDLASTISSIGIYLTLIRYNITGNNGKLNEFLNKSESLVSDATTSITDLIWAIKPKPELLTNLIIRVNNNFAELFRERGIEYKTISNLSEENVVLQPKIKQNIYLLIKEAMNNILKYAKAKNVFIEVKKTSSKVQITIKDDGIGFDFDKVKGKGHGLNNMKKRATDIGAHFKVTTKIGEGTMCELILKIP